MNGVLRKYNPLGPDIPTRLLPLPFMQLRDLLPEREPHALTVTCVVPVGEGPYEVDCSGYQLMDTAAFYTFNPHPR